MILHSKTLQLFFFDYWNMWIIIRDDRTRMITSTNITVMRCASWRKLAGDCEYKRHNSIDHPTLLSHILNTTKNGGIVHWCSTAITVYANCHWCTVNRRCVKLPMPSYGANILQNENKKIEKENKVEKRCGNYCKRITIMRKPISWLNKKKKSTANIVRNLQLTLVDSWLVSEWTFSCASSNSRRNFLNSCACFSSAELYRLLAVDTRETDEPWTKIINN